MNTRHYSSEGDYPFVPPLQDNLREIATAILDVYILIQGEPSGLTAPVPYPVTRLEGSIVVGAGRVVYLRSTATSGAYWDYTFTIPDVSKDGVIEQISPVGGDVTGMLVYKSNNLSTATFPEFMEAELEPARVQWHVETTEAILFKNISRCNSVEDEETLVEVLNTADIVDLTLRLENGYNTKVVYDDGTLLFDAGAGFGKGRMPNLGNTDPILCPEPDLDAAPEGVLTINGLLPNDGNIPLSVSSALYIEREAGRILIRKKQP